MFSVARRFGRFIERIQPHPAEVLRARTHFAQVRARLTKNFIVSRTVPIGSHAKQTAIYRISDVDILAVLRRREARWGGSYVGSGTLLGRVREDLVDRYPNTAIRRDGQAVVIGFGQGQHRVDVVPAIYYGAAKNGYPIYSIPDGLGEWLLTAPDIHAAYFRTRDGRSGGKLRRTVQMVKFWARARESPLQIASFHVEMVLASSGVAEGMMPYSQVLARAFALLSSRAGAALRDPCGISGLIQATDSDSKQLAIARSLGYAAVHAAEAHRAELLSDTDEAVRQWRIVFGDYFPVRLS